MRTFNKWFHIFGAVLAIVVFGGLFVAAVYRDGISWAVWGTGVLFLAISEGIRQIARNNRRKLAKL
jgi:predicted membrane channel-forming protein YqfA (hemolysin III family)